MDKVLTERYEIVEAVSSGGWGTVFKARDRNLPRFVALKVLHEHLVYDEGHMKRFQQEAEALTQLRSPYTCIVYDYGLLTDQRPYLAMEFVDGVSLDTLFAKKGAMALDQALPLMQQICEGLLSAHRLGIVHRDIKPGNIMLIKHEDGSQQVKIVDFGLAKLGGTENAGLTKTGDTMGTPHYMSPEQCLGQVLDVRADVYSLGCVFYEMLTGEKPLQGDSSFEVMTKQVNTQVNFNRDAQLPTWMQALILNMVAKNRDERFASLTEVLDALNNPKAVKLRKRRATAKNGWWQKAAVAVAMIVVTGFAIRGGLTVGKKMAKTKTPVNAYDEKLFQPTDPDEFTDQSLRDVLASGKRYHTFKLSRSKITNSALADLGKKQNLKWLAVSFTQITDKGLQQLPPTITYLNAIATDTGASPDGLSHLNKLTQAKLNRTYVSDPTLEALCKIPTLTTLLLARTQVTDAGIQHLPELPKLKHLSLSETAITDASAPALSKLTNLEILALRRTAITDTTLEALSELPGLRYLSLSGCRNITEYGIARLAKIKSLQGLELADVPVRVRALSRIFPTTTVSKREFPESSDEAAWDRKDRKGGLRRHRPSEETAPTDL